MMGKAKFMRLENCQGCKEVGFKEGGDEDLGGVLDDGRGTRLLTGWGKCLKRSR